MQPKQIYVIQMADGPVKIGISSKPIKRLALLQSAIPWLLSLVKTWTHARSLLVEYVAHDLSKSSVLRGEWFDMDADTACHAVEEAIRRVDSGNIPVSLELQAEMAEVAYKTTARGFALTNQAKGGRRSAEIKKIKAAAGVERIKQYWGMPADEWPTKMLLQMAGNENEPMAYNTVIAHIGYGRKVARQKYLELLRRKVTIAELETA